MGGFYSDPKYSLTPGSFYSDPKWPSNIVAYLMYPLN